MRLIFEAQQLLRDRLTLGPKLPLGQEKVGGCDVVVLVAVQRPEMKKNAIETNLALRNFRK
jgi:hypothetical protein